MREYRFSICYENSDNVFGYVSEKILDSIRCGCVPIYLGAPDIKNHIPGDCFIDRREFGTDAEVESFLASIDKRKYERYLDAIKSYMNSGSYIERLPGHYAQTVISFLKNKVPRESKEIPSEGRRKLEVLASIKEIRYGSFPEKCKKAMSLLKNGNRNDRMRLANAILSSVIKIAGISDFMTWIRIKGI